MCGGAPWPLPFTSRDPEFPHSGQDLPRASPLASEDRFPLLAKVESLWELRLPSKSHSSLAGAGAAVRQRERRAPGTSVENPSGAALWVSHGAQTREPVLCLGSRVVEIRESEVLCLKMWPPGGQGRIRLFSPQPLGKRLARGRWWARNTYLLIQE